jgi:hypothetical protein
MRKPEKLYCDCGTVVGESVFSHIDPLMRGFGSCSGEVYRNVYNGNEARDKNGMLIPLRGNRYMCKACYNKH